jgi:hypothetical protein
MTWCSNSPSAVRLITHHTIKVAVIVCLRLRRRKDAAAALDDLSCSLLGLECRTLGPLPPRSADPLGLSTGIVLAVGLGSCLVPTRRILAIQASEAMHADG